MAPYEYFDHTADMGLSVQAENLSQLFTDSALGMFSLMTSLDQFHPLEHREIRLKGENLEELLWNWLRELHYLFSTQRFVAREFIFKELNDKSLHAIARGERFDPKKHTSEREVKAVTHHQFKVMKNGTGWKAEIIFDI